VKFINLDGTIKKSSSYRWRSIMFFVILSSIVGKPLR
jgi:hypothetical protein